MSKFRRKRAFVSQKFTIFGIMKRTLLIFAAILFCSTIAKGGVPGVRTEFGVVAGVNHPISKFDMGQSTAVLSAKTGFTAGIHMGLRLVGIFGIQPEILYSYNTIGIADEKNNFTSDIKCSTLQIPVLASLRLALIRFNIGPVFTVMDNPTYLDKKSEKVMFGPVHPSLSYAAGVSVCLFKHLIVDARVSSAFKSVENFLSYDAKYESQSIKTSIINAQLKIGVLF